NLDYGDDAAFIHRKTFILLINPDPKSLWKNIEPDADAPYQKSNTATEQISSDDFRIFAASRRGRSHAHDGKFREDDFALKILENGWHLIIVADGAGSAKFSREGSRIAATTGIEFLTEAINNLIEPKFADLVKSLDAKNANADKEIRNLLYQTLCGAAHRAYKNIEREANTSQSVIKDFATTFLLTIVKKFNEKTFVASFGIGDGAICVYDERGGKSDLMNTPDGGEFSGQTRFLTMRELVSDGEEMLRRIKYNVYDDFTTLFMMTDGVSDPKFATDKNLLDAEKWREFGDELAKTIDFTESEKPVSQALLEWTDFWSQGEHDDRTIAFLKPKSKVQSRSS
ncbi:MAG: protein phosphatase 2C domain-containing protein, partial [Pyrinomonadaceae bacterium]|nr:protein phosphatase 2C domain-containing protein [Pyrinomonadaceae bacterium]